MTGRHGAGSLSAEVALLERAINYARGSLPLVTPERFTDPTPCRAWDLRSLLCHMYDSLVALHEALGLGYMGLDVSANGERPADPVAAVRRHACALLGACTGTGPHVISVAGKSVTNHIVAGAGAVEVAVHGWDVARACRQDRPIPDALADRLLPISRFLVSEGDRPSRFSPPVDVAPETPPGDRLVAFLGRQP